jgi:hypothetical protein
MARDSKLNLSWEPPQYIRFVILGLLLLGYGLMLVHKKMKDREFAAEISRDIALQDLELESLAKRKEKIKYYQSLIDDPKKQAQLAEDEARTEAMRKSTIDRKQALERERAALLGK